MCGSPSNWCTPIARTAAQDRKSTRLNSSHGYISYAVFCLKKKKKKARRVQLSDVVVDDLDEEHSAHSQCQRAPQRDGNDHGVTGLAGDVGDIVARVVASPR